MQSFLACSGDCGNRLFLTAVAYLGNVYSVGQLLHLLIQLTAGLLSQLIGTFGFATSVFLYIGSLAYIERTKTLNNIPAWFLGLIILFGVHPPLEPLPILQILIPIAAGFVFAWLNNIAVEKIHGYQVQKSQPH